MQIYQYALVFINGVFFTLAITYGFKSLLVYRKLDKFFYFALLSFAGFIYTLSELFLTLPGAPLTHLIFHKIKLFSSIFCAVGVVFLIVKIILPSFHFPVFCLLLPSLPLLTLPSNWFSSYPIKEIRFSLLDLDFHYYLGTPRISYHLYAIFTILVFVYIFIQLIKAKLKNQISFIAVLLPFPMLLAVFNDFAVSRDLYKNVMLSEFFVFFFVVYIFYHFYREEQANYTTMKKLNFELENLVTQRTQALEASHHTLENQHAKVKMDLHMARRIQQCLMPDPSALPLVSKLDFTYTCHAMEELGGDFIDIYQANPGEFFFLLADVSGHGPSAALITSMLKISFSSNVKKTSDPAQIFTGINQELYPSIGDLWNYISATLLYVNLEKGELQHVSAGHPPILLLRAQNQEIIRLKSGGVFLGIFADPVYHSQKEKLIPGDRLLLYSDGITEVRNAAKKFFGLPQLSLFLQENYALKPKTFVESLHETLKDFCGHCDYHDDQAIIYLHYLG